MPFLVRFAQRFRRLLWKLTFFYLFTTLLALIVAGTLLLLLGLTLYPTNGFASEVGTVAQNVGANFLGPFANRAALGKALSEWHRNSGFAFEGFVVVVDPAGRVLAAAGDHAPATGTFLLPEIPDRVQRLLRDAFTHVPSTVTDQTTTISDENGTMYLVAPVVSQQRVRGALLVKAQQVQLVWPDLWNSTPFLLYAATSILVFFVGAGTVGLVFGVVTAHGLVRRIKRILASAEKWRQGDFSTFVADSSADELGQLARRLNHMAQQFHDLLHMRQTLATLQERNRLARELHDSVKQHVFALSIWVRNANALIGHDQDAARVQLAEAEQGIRQTQQELSALIRALRPVALMGQDLGQALQEYVQEWQKRTGIPVIFEVNGEQKIAPAVEEVFFRITQEALTNVVRHSQASLVTLLLDSSSVVSLAISDNGCGFDVKHVGESGVGLASMRERVEALHGQIEIHSQQGQGTTITVRCMCQSEPQANGTELKEER